VPWSVGETSNERKNDIDKASSVRPEAAPGRHRKGTKHSEFFDFEARWCAPPRMQGAGANRGRLPPIGPSDFCHFGQ